MGSADPPRFHPKGLLPESLSSGVPGDRVCTVVTWHRPAIPEPYTKTCYCGPKTQWTAPAFAQDNVDSAACQKYGSAWGGALLLAMAVATALYLVGGVGYEVKVKGQPVGAAALPHKEFWLAQVSAGRSGSWRTRRGRQRKRCTLRIP